VLGLNTPEMQAPPAVREAFVRAHPVAALALLPAWFAPESQHGISVAFRAESNDYTVTSNPNMGVQVVVVADSAASGAPQRVRFRGYRSFEVDLAPGTLTPSRGAP
jgi:hypothetical protein